MKKRDGRVSYSVHPSPILGDGRMDALKDGRGWTGDGRTMDGGWTRRGALLENRNRHLAWESGQDVSDNEGPSEQDECY
jgi:hypothetical protein